MAVTLHNVVATKAGKQVNLVEVRLEDQPVGRFIPATSAKVGPLVTHIEGRGGIPVARALVQGNSLKADVTVYVARASDVAHDWLDAFGPQ